MVASVTSDPTPLLSHTFSTENMDVAIQDIVSRITQQGDKPYATVETQLEILEQLSQFEFGRFLMLNRGLNGYWTHYVLTHPWVRQGTPINHSLDKLTPTEHFLLERAPSMLATQERFKIFLQENQKEVQNGAKLACIPCGMMGELLYLNFDNIDTVELIGLDYDPNSLNDARSLATKQNLLPMITLYQGDAWQMTFDNEFDLISSNGLNIYEPDDAKVTQLYQSFYNALKSGGKLVSSFLTAPPTLSESCEWDMSCINPADLLKQKIIFADILEVKWRCFRTSIQTQLQLQSVGFERIEFIYDKAKLFPTVIAYKKTN
jgi:SAM-dependent methyltransferase